MSWRSLPDPARTKRVDEPSSLLSEQGDHVGSITFYEPDVTLGHDFVSRASRPLLHLHTDMLSSVLALLNSDKSVFVEYTDRGGRLTTTDDSTV